jgi:hypothetical protein
MALAKGAYSAYSQGRELGRKEVKIKNPDGHGGSHL